MGLRDGINQRLEVVERVLPAQRLAHHRHGEPRPPAGRRIRVREARLVQHYVASKVVVRVEERERERKGAHQRAIAGTRLGIAGNVAPIGVTECPTGLIADIVRGVTPRTEPRPHGVGVVPAVLQERLAEGDSHLGVVGELTGGPTEASSADHLAATTEYRCGEPPAVIAWCAELERCTESITDCGAEHEPECPLVLFVREAFACRCHLHAGVNDTGGPQRDIPRMWVLFSA